MAVVQHERKTNTTHRHSPGAAPTDPEGATDWAPDPESGLLTNMTSTTRMTTREADPEIRDLEERLLDPVVRRSPEAVGRLLDDDFEEIGSSGRLFDRDALIEALAGETTSGRMTIDDWSTHPVGPDVVLAVFSTRATGSDGVSRVSRRSSIWIRRGGRWLLRFHQGTRVPAEPSAASGR
jgi:hypothetical protein